MVSRLARRSGVAVVQIAEHLGWSPDVVYHVGVGMEHAEVKIMKNEVWPEVRFVGFEPSARARESILKEGYPGELFPYALGNRVGPAILYAPHLHVDGCSLFQRLDSDKKFQIEMTTLDEMLKVCPLDPKEKVLLWLDCEGSELDVLEGGQKLLAQVEFINIELTSVPRNPDWADAKTLHNWLNARGYKRQWIHTHRLHCGQSDGIYVKDYLWKEEFSCCPCQRDDSGDTRELLAMIDHVISKGAAAVSDAVFVDMIWALRRNGGLLSRDFWHDAIEEDFEMRKQYSKDLAEAAERLRTMTQGG